MKARTRNLLAVALCGALAAPLASAQLVGGNIGARVDAAAQVPTRTVDQTRANVDRLRDRVERQEARADVDAQADAAVHSNVMQRETWVRLDIDGDGRISLAEAEDDAVLADKFVLADVDADGFVSDAEYHAHAQAAHVAEASATGAAHAAGHSAAVVRAAWADLDADGDGRISLLEADVDAGFGAGFEDMDSDGDGFVTEAEFRAEAKADLVPPR